MEQAYRPTGFEYIAPYKQYSVRFGILTKVTQKVKSHCLRVALCDLASDSSSEWKSATLKTEIVG